MNGVLDFQEVETSKKTHPHLGKVKVLGKKGNSRTIVLVKCVDRGKGYDPDTGTYKGVKRPAIIQKGDVCNGWSRQENRQYGCTDEVHINTLT